MNMKMINRTEKDTYTFFDKRPARATDALSYRSDFTLIIIEKGTGAIQVNNDISQFHSSNVILIGPYTPYRITDTSNDHQITAIVFRVQAMGEAFINSCQLAHVRSLLERSSYGLKYSGTICGKVCAIAGKIENTFGFQEVLSLFAILDILSLSGNHQILTTERMQLQHINKNKEKIERIKHYLHEHAYDDVYIEDLARKFNMAERTFLRFFKSNTGMPVMKYLNKIRIDKACQLLSNSRECITGISTTVGYASLSNFYHQFHTIVGTTPQKYRARLCGVK